MIGVDICRSFCRPVRDRRLAFEGLLQKGIGQNPNSSLKGWFLRLPGKILKPDNLFQFSPQVRGRLATVHAGIPLNLVQRWHGYAEKHVHVYPYVLHNANY